MGGIQDSNQTSARDNTQVEIADGGGSGRNAHVLDDNGVYRLATSGKITGISGTSFPMINRTDVSTTVTASGVSDSFDSEGLGMLNVQPSVTAISGTNPTFQIDVELSDDNVNFNTNFSTVRFTATGSQRVQSLRCAARYYRFRWFVGGTSPSITFEIGRAHV